VAQGLSYAHGQGVVRRDVKPANIILTKQGAKIMDFGLARVEGDATLTIAGSAVGTPHYMSPEQIVGDSKETDGRADQYSLHCIAFEMLTRERLFEGGQPMEVITKHSQEAPRDPRQLNSAVPAEVAAVVLKMLSKQPDQRFASALEALEAMESETKKLVGC